MEGPPPGVASLAWYRRQRTYILAGALAGGCYAAYKAYNSHQAAEASQSLRKLVSALARAGEGATALSDTLATFSLDLQRYLASDDEEMPRSLRQLARLAQSAEAQGAVRALVAAAVQGATTSLPPEDDQQQQQQQQQQGGGVVAQVLEALLSDRGRSLVGLAVSVATRNSTEVLCDFVLQRQQTAAAAQPPGPDSAAARGPGPSPSQLSWMQALLQLLTSERGERLLGLLISRSVGTAVGVYVDKVSGYNLYDDMLAALARSEQREALSELLNSVTATFCREAARAAFAGSSGTTGGGGGSSSAASSGGGAGEAGSQGAPRQQGAAQQGAVYQRAAAGSSHDEDEAGSSGDAESVDLTARVMPLHTSPSLAASGAGVDTYSLFGVLAQASQRPELRSLCLDACRVGTREMMGSVMQQQQLLVSGASPALQRLAYALMCKAYLVLSALLFMALYSVGSGQWAIGGQ